MCWFSVLLHYFHHDNLAKFYCGYEWKFPQSADVFAFYYDAKDVLCLEQLEVVDVNNSNKKKEFIQEYVSWGWNPNEDRQSWKSKVWYFFYQYNII